MAIVPEKKIEKIEFYENHVGPWGSAAVALGTTTAAVTDLTTKTAAARAAFNAREAAQDVARAATLTYDAAVDAMVGAGADILKQIKAKAAITGGDSIYALAQIPAPAAPSPVGPPGKPNTFKLGLQEDGTLVMS
jgi:hypothetical protein